MEEKTRIIASLSVAKRYPNMDFKFGRGDLIVAVCKKDGRECLDDTGFHDFSISGGRDGDPISVNNVLTAYRSDCKVCPRNSL